MSEGLVALPPLQVEGRDETERMGVGTGDCPAAQIDRKLISSNNLPREARIQKVLYLNGGK
jgi:hypothetical protein